MQYTLSYKNISMSVSSLGAELHSLKKWNKEFLYQKKDGFWQRQSPILFPIVWALKGGIYRFDGKEYSLSQHGFARDKEWIFLEKSENSLAFCLSLGSSIRMNYPFDFQIELIYIIDESGLKVQYTVKNIGSNDMYFSIGGHPAFMMEEDISVYSLSFPDDWDISVDRLDGGLLSKLENYPLTEGSLSLDERLFEKDAMVLRSIQSKKIHLQKWGKDVLIFDRGNFPHFGIWKQPNAPFLCLEPWSGYADTIYTSWEFTEKSGINFLKSGEVQDFWWKVQI